MKFLAVLAASVFLASCGLHDDSHENDSSVSIENRGPRDCVGTYRDEYGLITLGYTVAMNGCLLVNQVDENGKWCQSMAHRTYTIYRDHPEKVPTYKSDGSVVLVDKMVPTPTTYGPWTCDTKWSDKPFQVK